MFQIRIVRPATRALRQVVTAIRGNRWLAAGLAMAASFVLADLVGHVYYRFRHGAFLWNDPKAHVFRIWPFLTGVDDERVVVPKRNFEHFGIQFDSNGFRVGSNSYEGKTKNIVVIGDSVPFGWGAAPTETVPSHLSELLARGAKDSIGIINAAVPSYSLHQAVKHYEHDVDGRFPVTAVVLQIWDPAEQLAKQGRSWKRTMNWATADAEMNWFERKFVTHPNVVQYSSFLYYAFQATLSVSTGALSPDDQTTKAFFIAENVRTLGELGSRLSPGAIPLYLLGLNPKTGVPSGGGSYGAAVRWTNESLETYARETPRTYFIDIARRFDAAGRDGLFADDCCHLTDAGAALEATAIYEEMSKNGDPK